MHTLILILISVILSSLVYLYLIYKTGIRPRFLYSDNLLVAGVSIATGITLQKYLYLGHLVPGLITVMVLVPVLAFALTMIRFWRTPVRNSDAGPEFILSPADGRIIYIKRIESGEDPVSVKNGRIARLVEITHTKLLQTPCWLIGINMTLFDVHKNAAPVSGTIRFNESKPGKFHSLKSFESETENERHTMIIENEDLSVGVVQIASRLVRRIDNYVQTGQHIRRGEWYGMIRFGSQVDLIIPAEYLIDVRVGDQVSAALTIIATPPNENTD